MLLIDEYHKQLNQHHFVNDPDQQAIVTELAQLQHQLEQYLHKQNSLSSKLLRLINKQTKAPEGCYIWGLYKTPYEVTFYSYCGNVKETTR